MEHKIKNAVFPRMNMVCKCGLYLGKTCKSLDYIVAIQFKFCISTMRKIITKEREKSFLSILYVNRQQRKNRIGGGYL